MSKKQFPINLIGRRFSQITTDDDVVKSQKYSFSHYLSPSPSSRYCQKITTENPEKLCNFKKLRELSFPPLCALVVINPSIPSKQPLPLPTSLFPTPRCLCLLIFFLEDTESFSAYSVVPYAVPFFIKLLTLP